MSTTLEYTEPLVRQIADSSNDHQEWLARGRELARADSHHQFAIGDWLIEGEDRWSRKIYAEAADIFTGYTKETLYTFASVARSVKTLIRIKDLSWAHHRALARFGPETQRELLEYAHTNNLPLRGFESYVRNKYPSPVKPPKVDPEPQDSRPTDQPANHWRGMPEFVQDDLTPFKTIYVHFENQEHLDAFAELVGQIITPKTRSIWYPKREKARHAEEYIDAEAETINEEVGS
jgi:hypothetical protein